ncbi:MAG: hypothetical protein ACTHNM_09855 [Dyella sp.]|uniref:hypothetical protein n=1 Tax=Dyella sp. TaxID=1869338 RepID=UPI003F7ED0D5
MKWIVCAIVLAFLNGCGIKEQVVRVSVPDVHANPEQGPVIQVNPVRDNRQASFLAQFPAATRDKNVGGVVRGGGGINVVLDSTTTTLKTHSIIVQALRNMGYRTADHCETSCPSITPRLNTFAVLMPFNFWRAATYSQHMLADIAVQITLQEQGHTYTFEASGHGSNVYQVVSQENWETALDRAVKDFDSNFQQQMASQMDQAATKAPKATD